MTEMTIAERETKSPASTTAVPAYFLSLRVANVRCFGQAQTLDLSDGQGGPAMWTVLLGENGVGKTTILQCLAAMQPVRYDGMTVLNPNGSIEFVPAYLPVGWLDAEKDFRFLYQKVPYIKRIAATDAALSDRVAAEIITARAGDQVSETALHLIGTAGDPSFRRATHTLTDVTRLVPFGYGASRRMGRGPISESEARYNCETLFDDHAELTNAEEWLVIADYATKTGTPVQKRHARERLENVKSLLTGILPDVSDFRFRTSDDSAMTPRVEAKTPYGWVRVADLSLGYKSALSWMVDFAARLFERYPKSDNPLAEPAVCLVDEIDLHLHPRWQRELMQRLTNTFPNTQFIVTAHSPLIVQSAPNANLALLRREGDHVVIDNDVDEIRNWRVDQILTSDLFGLDSARPSSLDSAFKERQEILSKPEVSDDDRRRLSELERDISSKMPLGETPSDIRAMDALRLAAAALERKNRK